MPVPRALVLAAICCLGTATASAEEGVDPAKLFQQGRWREAADAYRAITVKEPDNQTAWHRLGYSLHALGEIEEALPAHERAASLPGPAVPTAAYNAACASSLLGDTDGGCAWFRKAVAAGFRGGSQIDIDADLDAIRDDPRFLAVRNPLVRSTVFRTFRGVAQAGDPHQFDFWIGNWDTTNFALGAGGTWAPSGALESRVFPVLGGNAILEWSAGSNPGNTTQGFSIRTFDPGKNEWIVLLNWPSKDRPSFSVMTGQFRLGRCEIVSPWAPTQAGGAQTRFTFSDTASDRFRWDMALTKDGGTTWSTTLLFEGRRRAAGAPAPATGPSKTNSLCSGQAFRRLDFLLGRWEGERSTRGKDGAWQRQPVALHAYSVMEGSAVVEELVVGEGEDAAEEFAIQSYEPGRNAWVRYALDDRTPHFTRHEFKPSDGPVEWKGAAGPGSSGARGTIRWEHPDDDALLRTWSEKGDPVWRDDFRRVKDVK